MAKRATVLKVNKNKKNNKYSIETTCGVFCQDFAERNNIRPIEQTTALYESFHVGDVVEYQNLPYSARMLLRNVTQEKIQSFINQSQQDAVVISVIQEPARGISRAKTKLTCFSPVWGKFYHTTDEAEDIQRGDILTFSREQFSCTGTYSIVKNKTVEEIQRTRVEKILSAFDQHERNILAECVKKNFR